MTAPETPGQALVWETVKTQYLHQGLCHRCAALASYGHQLGHAVLDPPCTVCRPLVARFPISAGRVWRKASRSMLRGGPTLSLAPAGPSEPAEADDNSSTPKALVS